MRRLWGGLGLLLSLGLVGCASTNITPRPPKHVEEITVPPASDEKFNLPPRYPADTLNQNDPSQLSKGAGGRPNMSGVSGLNSTNGMSGRGGMAPAGMGSGAGMNSGGMGGR
jgi:hypothetical protein